MSGVKNSECRTSGSEKKAALNYEDSDGTFRTFRNENQPLNRRRHKVSEFDACKQGRTEYGVALEVMECLET